MRKATWQKNDNISAVKQPLDLVTGLAGDVDAQGRSLVLRTAEGEVPVIGNFDAETKFTPSP